MTDEEVGEFLASHRTTQVATVGAGGMPHLVAMWYGMLDGRVVMWTYAKSQKARNLRRRPQIACLVETGERYEELQGVSITGRALLSADPAEVRRVGEAVLLARGGADPLAPLILERTAAKRVAIVVEPLRIASWDHRKLGSSY